MALIDLTDFESDENYTDFLTRLGDALGFDHASYATTSLITRRYSRLYLLPRRMGLRLHYAKMGMQRFDPTLRAAMLSVAPVDWQRLAKTDDFTRVFFDAHDFGITDRGLSVPIRGPYGDFGLLSVTRDCSKEEWRKFLPTVIGDLQMAAVNLHDNVLNSEVLPKALARPSLSKREQEILQWVAHGKSQQDIGDILSISHRTVEVHIRSGREKLGALTTAQAVGRAIRLGIIQPG